MKYILTIGLLLSVVCCFVVSDVVADAPDAHAMADIRNADKEQKRLQGIIDEYIGKRDRYISLANDLKVRGGGSLGSLQTTMISSLSTSTQTTLANTLALTLRAFLSIYGSSSLASAIDSAVSDASSYHGSAQYLYNNPTRLWGYDAANSAIEAWYDGSTATDHYNAYHSSQKENPPNPPHGPGNINFPKFECPGPCTQSWTTVDAAINTHHRKCGNAAPLSRLLSFTEQQAMLAARSVSEGCGVEWYSCDSNHSSKESNHKVRTCAKGVWKTRYKDYTNGKERYRSHTCGDSFRNCMPHTDYHGSSTFKTAHSETDGEGNIDPPPDTADNPPPPTDNTPNCPDCTSDCSSPCSCTNSGTCGGTVVTPPEPPPPDPPSNCDAGCCSGYCWHADNGGCAVTCVHCNEPYNLCTSQQGDCSVDPHGWHSSE